MKFDSNSVAMLERYIVRSGWIEGISKYRGLRKFSNEFNDSMTEILIPNVAESTSETQNKYLDEAISVLAFFEDKDVNSLEYLISRGGHDLHKIRISQRDNLATKLTIAQSLITGVSDIFKESAFLEVEVSPKRAADNFIKSCNFGHTYKGSFGFQVETPVGNGEMELFQNSAPDPIGRLVSKRIMNGFDSLSRSLEIESDEPLVSGADTGFNGRMCNVLANLSNELGIFDGLYSVYWSPIQYIDQHYLDAKGELNRKAGFMLDRAAQQLLRDEREYDDITFIGFVEMVKSEKPFFEQEGNRIIAVKGHCDEIGKATLRFEVDIEEYRVAYDAHGKCEVILKCNIRKRPKGWEVMKLNSIRIKE